MIVIGIDPGAAVTGYGVVARAGGRDWIVNRTLKDLLAVLDPALFVQTHKAYIVNLGKIEKLSPMFNGNFEITLKDSADGKIPLSRRYARKIKEALGNW